MYSEKGQTLLEVVVVIAVAVIIVGALVFATISSLRNSATAKNQAQATKLAQEGIEKVRAGRDRGSSIGGSFPGGSSWLDLVLWSTNISSAICNSGNNCYFKLDSSGNLFYLNVPSPTPPSGGESIGNFIRYIIISDDADFGKWKIATSLVIWSDFAGQHESRITTILRKL